MTTTTATGPVQSIGDGDYTGSIDLAPAARNGQPVIAVWAGDGTDEPALIDLRTALLLAAKLPGLCDQAVTLAAEQLTSA